MTAAHAGSRFMTSSQRISKASRVEPPGSGVNMTGSVSTFRMDTRLSLEVNTAATPWAVVVIGEDDDNGRTALFLHREATRAVRPSVCRRAPEGDRLRRNRGRPRKPLREPLG